MLKFFFSFIIFFSFWIVMSGKFDMFHLALGVISCLIVHFWMSSLLYGATDKSLGQRLSEIGRFFIYSGWLFWQIVLSNFHVIRLAFHPHVKEAISSHLVEFDSSLSSDIGKYILANSITLTPGTITIEINQQRFLVHAITKHAADGLPQDFERKIKYVFGEQG